jgi:hypothetical protein
LRFIKEKKLSVFFGRKNQLRNVGPVSLTFPDNAIAADAANGTAIGTITVSDGDGPASAYKYSLTDDDTGRFAIGELTGIVTKATASDLPVGTRSITVLCNDRGNTLSQSFSIIVSSPISAPTDIAFTPATMSTGSASGAAVATATASGGSGPYTWAFEEPNGSSSGAFDVDEATGAVTVAQSPLGAGTLSITLQATNAAGSYSENFDITVELQDPTGINFSGTILDNAANGATVGTATTVDPNPVPPTPTYSLQDDDTGRFAINSSTGVVTKATASDLPVGTRSITIRSTTSAGFVDAIKSITVIDHTADTSIVNLSVQNYSGSVVTAPELSFAHGFRQGDVPAGSKVSITQGGSEVKYTAARRNAWPDGSLRCADFICKAPSNIAGSTTASFVITSTGGDFDVTLPGGVTAGDIVTDITTNFAEETVELTGLTTSAGATAGSGTWSAGRNAALTAGTYRVLQEGPAAIDLCINRKVLDGATPHSSIWVQWWVTAFLNTTTGAVTKLRTRRYLCQTNKAVAHDKYRCQIAVKLGSTTVRNFAKAHSFAPSDINTSTGRITIASHTFIYPELVRFTNSGGALPAGWPANTDFWVNWDQTDPTNKVYVCSTQGAAGQGNAGVLPGGQGTGTHTLTVFTHILQAQKLCLARDDGLHDWQVPTTEAFSGEPTVHCIHDTAYLQRTKLIPPIDLSITLANTTATAANSWKWTPGSIGRQVYGQNTPGGNVSYGAPFNEYSARATRYRNDRTGYVQTARIVALGKGSWPVNRTLNDTTFRIPVMSNGPDRAGGQYSGLGAPTPASYFFANGVKSADYVTATSNNLNSFSWYDFTHFYSGNYACYLFEGGADILDLAYFEANWLMTVRFGNTAVYVYPPVNPPPTAPRFHRIDGVNYVASYTMKEPRAVAWAFQILADIAAISGDNDAEGAYFQDVWEDHQKVVATWLSYTNDSCRALGGLDPNAQHQLGPYQASAANSEGTSNFMQEYILTAFCYAYLRFPTANMNAIAAHQVKFFDNFVTNVGNAAYLNSYFWKKMEAPGLASGGTTYSTPENCGVIDIDTEIVVWDSDGTVRTCAPAAAEGFTHQNGDRIWLFDTYLSTVGAFGNPPAEYSKYTWYYARQCQGTNRGTFKLATTNSDLTIIGSVTPYSSNSGTLGANITSTTATTITLSAPVTFPVGNAGATQQFYAIRIGSEVMRVTAGYTTTTLTVRRGQGGTTAATHNSGATVEVLKGCRYYSDLQNRAGDPALPWRSGSWSLSSFGYGTMAWQGMGFAYLAGLTTRDGFDRLDAWFQLLDGPTTGVQGFGAQNYLAHSVDIDVTF